MVMVVLNVVAEIIVSIVVVLIVEFPYLRDSAIIKNLANLHSLHRKTKLIRDGYSTNIKQTP